MRDPKATTLANYLNSYAVKIMERVRAHAKIVKTLEPGSKVPDLIADDLLTAKGEMQALALIMGQLNELWGTESLELDQLINQN